MRLNLSVIVLIYLAAGPVLASPTGEHVYAKQCARCHGERGEGTKAAPDPLFGDRSVPALTKYIARTMPEDDPGSLSATDAEAVSQYIFDAFYSPDAQERNKPPRIELARLTVGQYRAAIADVLSGFRGPVRWGTERGLKGEYYKNRRFNRNDRMLDRVDASVNFDFGTESPAPGKIEDHEFSIRWEGSLLAPDTGEYEFVIETDHATRLWVNDNRKPLIDAWVKSGNDTEYKGSIYLIAGQIYHVRLEFSKAKQGVDDSKKQKEKPKSPPAFVRLMWQRPQFARQVIPSQNLSTARVSERFAVSNPFPPDDRSLGWVRGTTVSKAWDAATTEGALDTASYVVLRLDELAGTRPNDKDRQAKIKAFAKKFVERAFRRPLTKEQETLYVDRAFEVGADEELAIRRVVVLALKSPWFLYREVSGKSDAFDVASRLSFAMWDSVPDQALLTAAANGQLKTPEQIRTQANRMLDDPRAKAKLREFLHSWLKTDHAPDMAKDSKRFPGFTEDVMSDLRTSLELTLDDLAWNGSRDFRQLLLDDKVYLNGRLAEFYGVKLPEDAPFQKVRMDDGKRAGILSHPYLMAAFAYNSASSPIHRGVFIARGVLGLNLRPPQEAFSPLSEDLHPGLTTRERVALQTRPVNCMGCHATINPLGFTLENFDAVGRFREKDNGKSVDATGTYQTRTGEIVSFSGVRDLASYLAGSEEVPAAFAEQLFQHMVKQPIRAYGPEMRPEIRASFAANGYDITKLMVEIATRAATPPQ